MLNNKYTQVPAGSVSALGEETHEDFTFEFTTSYVTVENIYPNDSVIAPRKLRIFVLFDQQIDPENILSVSSLYVRDKMAFLCYQT